MNQSIIDTIKNNDYFQMVGDVLDPSSGVTQVRDADFLITKQGYIVNIEGWYHPKKQIIGEILYVPYYKGNKQIFSQAYQKTTLYPDTYDVVPYPQRAEVLQDYGVLLPRITDTSYFMTYKHVFPHSEFIGHLRSDQALKKILTQDIPQSSKLHKDLANIRELLSLDQFNISLGLTGAPLLGNYENYHDLDLVFSGDLKTNITIAKTMRDLVIQDTHCRLFEGGKAWLIRFYNEYRHIMCTFFAYANPADIPFHQPFTMDIIHNDITFTGTVIDDTHGIYTPTVLHTAIEQIQDLDEQKNLQQHYNIPQTLQVIIYHTASRGDFFNEDRITGRGALVQIQQPDKDPYMAICAIHRDSVWNLTPPWKGYYANA